MANVLTTLQADISNLQAAITAAGSNDAKRGAAFGIARATAQKIRDAKKLSSMLALVATQPVMAAALLVDALRNRMADLPLHQLEAVEAQLTLAGKLLEDRHDVLAAPALEAAAQDFDDQRYEAAQQITDSILA